MDKTRFPFKVMIYDKFKFLYYCPIPVTSYLNFVDVPMAKLDDGLKKKKSNFNLIKVAILDFFSVFYYP